MLLLYYFLFMTVVMNPWIRGVKATLTKFPTGKSCPGTVVNFTCNTGSAFLRWTATLGTESIDEVTFSTDFENAQQMETTRRLGNHIFKASFVPESGIISNLSIVADMELDGLTVECKSPSFRGGSVLSMITIPSFNLLNVASIHNGTFFATLYLRWNSSSSADTNYIVAVSSDLDSSVWTTDTKAYTSLILIMPYNVNHTISITAVNCAGTSRPTEIDSFIAVNCSTPPAAWDGWIMEPYSDTTEGSVVYFHCDEGISSFGEMNKRIAMAVCERNGKWLLTTQWDTECNLQVDHSNNTTVNIFNALTETESLFECERGSDVNVILLGSASGGSFVIGSVISCFLFAVYQAVIHRKHTKGNTAIQENTTDMDVCENVAYETVNMANNI